MSDLTAANCGCNTSCGNNTNNCNGIFGGNYSWLILLLLFFGGNGNGCGSNLLSNNGCGGDGNGCCEWIIWLLILSNLCGGNNGCGCNGVSYNTTSNNCGCGC